METFGVYSLKAGIILTLFWSIYLLFLQKETFFRFNRFFLLTGLFASLILPLYTIHYIVEVKTSGIPVHLISEVENDSPSIVAVTDNFHTLIKYCISYLPVIYFTVFFIILIFRISGLLRLLTIIHRSKHKRYKNYKLIESSELNKAFSFFHFIIIPKILSETEKNIILKHEETHIAQNHWVDLFLINILSLIWWFNPIIQLYDKAIRNNHEYLADKEALKQHEQADYQQTLVNQWMKTPVFPMANSFSYSNQLKRIKMMKKNISNPSKKLFSLLAIPAIAVFFMAFSKPEYKYSGTDSSSESEKKEPVTYALVTLDDQEAIKYEDEPALHLNKTTPTLNSSTVKKSHKEKTQKKENPLTIFDGEIAPYEITNHFEPNQIYLVTMLKDNKAIEKFGEDGRNGAIIITSRAARKALFDSSAYDIKGTIVDESGNPISKALVEIVEKETYTDPMGNFSLRIVPGDLLYIKADGYRSITFQSDENVKIISAQITLKK